MNKRLLIALPLALAGAVVVIGVIWLIFYVIYSGAEAQLERHERQRQRQELITESQRQFQRLESAQQYFEIIDATLGPTGELDEKGRQVLVGVIWPLRNEVNKEVGLPEEPLQLRDLTAEDLALLTMELRFRQQQVLNRGREIAEASAKLFKSTPGGETALNDEVESLVNQQTAKVTALGKKVAIVRDKLNKLQEVLKRR